MMMAGSTDVAQRPGNFTTVKFPDNECKDDRQKYGHEGIFIYIFCIFSDIREPDTKFNAKPRLANCKNTSRSAQWVQIFFPIFWNVNITQYKNTVTVFVGLSKPRLAVTKLSLLRMQ